MPLPMYRQGDVLLIKRDGVSLAEAQAVPRVRGRVILASGEATGHAHAISSPLAELFEDRDDGLLYLRVSGLCDLTHEEHNPITLEEGVYEVRRQREYLPEDPSQARRVAD